MIHPPKPETQHLKPGSSVWPVVLAAGAGTALFGLVVWTPAFSAVGILGLVVGVVGVGAGAGGWELTDDRSGPYGA